MKAGKNNIIGHKQNSPIPFKAGNQASESAILQTYQTSNNLFSSGGKVTQLETKIDDGGTEAFKLAGVSVGQVGKSINAHLDPEFPEVGTSTNGSDALDDVMPKIPGPSTWKRGHLLNHDLGGKAITENLFPITTAANSEHKIEVENPIKQWLNDDCEIDYDITAQQNNDQTADGTFECEAKITSAPEDSGETVGKTISKTIHSNSVAAAATKKFRDSKADETKESFASVTHKAGNEVFRDDYAAYAKVPETWKHTTHSDYLSTLPKKRAKLDDPVDDGEHEIDEVAREADKEEAIALTNPIITDNSEEDEEGLDNTSKGDKKRKR